MPFKLGVMGIDHGHIFGMLSNMVAQGCTCSQWWTGGPAVTESKFAEVFPQLEKVADYRTILDDPEVAMVLISAIPCDRADLAIAAMEAHPWKGNVRELRNFAQRITYRAISARDPNPVRFDANALDPFDSPYRPAATLSEAEAIPAATASAPLEAPPRPDLSMPFQDQVNLFETELVDRALAAANGHQGKAAKILGLTYHQFRGLLKKHDYGKGAGKPKDTPPEPQRSM